jgi:hypothetical protein
MPVTVTVEDGTGKADANSYASVAQADAYFGTRPRSTLWSPLTADQKGQFLIHATRILDAAVVWKGEPMLESQALAFPRTPSELEAAEVPAAIPVALFEIAYLSIGKDLTAEPSLNGVKLIEVGPIKIEANASTGPDLIPRWVRNLIAHYGTPRGSAANATLVRA